jgi:hypothetical protein
MQIWLINNPDQTEPVGISGVVLLHIRNIARATHVKELVIPDSFLEKIQYEEVMCRKGIENDDIFIFFYPSTKQDDSRFKRMVMWFPSSLRKVLFVLSEEAEKGVISNLQDMKNAFDNFVTSCVSSATLLNDCGVRKDKIHTLEFPDITSPALNVGEPSFLNKTGRLVCISDRLYLADQPSGGADVELLPAAEIISPWVRGRIGIIDTSSSGYAQGVLLSLYLSTGTPVLVEDVSPYAPVVERLKVGWSQPQGEDCNVFAQELSERDYKLAAERASAVCRGMNVGVNTRRMLFRLVETLR